MAECDGAAHSWNSTAPTMHAHSAGPVHRHLIWPALALLVAVSLGATIVIAWPERPSASRGTSPVVTDSAPAAAAIPATPVPATSNVVQQESAAAEVPPELFAMYAEPALLDLLEDAESPDLQVREEALRLLRDHEMLPQEPGASTSVQFPSRH
jgi:hypothetical protein